MFGLETNFHGITAPANSTNSANSEVVINPKAVTISFSLRIVWLIFQLLFQQSSSLLPTPAFFFKSVWTDEHFTVHVIYPPACTFLHQQPTDEYTDIFHIYLALWRKNRIALGPSRAPSEIHVVHFYLGWCSRGYIPPARLRGYVYVSESFDCQLHALFLIYQLDPVILLGKLDICNCMWPVYF